MQMTPRVGGRASMRNSAMAGALLLAGAFAGCVIGGPMAPVQIPSSHGQLKLCTGTPALPPNNLATNPNYVGFSVDVIESTGAPTIGLAQSDFSATENGKPIPIAYFREEQGRPPVSIGILVDKSGSMVTKLPVVSASVDALMPKLDACDEVMIYAFGMDPIVVQDFTTDHALAAERLKLVGAWGGTPFYDGVSQGIARLGASHYPDRVAIIFTDDAPGLLGSASLDNGSTIATRDVIVNSALNSQSRFFLVGVGKPDAKQFPIGIGIGPWAIGSAPNGVGAEDLKTFATDLKGEFTLIAAEPDENAPKVKAQARDTGAFGPTPKYAPLAADPAEIQQFATSIASQIDRHYVVVVVASAPSASAASQIAIRGERPESRTTFRQINVSSKTP